MTENNKVFISYSWDDDAHKEWVLMLANYLISNGGCDVILDQYDLKAGSNMTHFMESSVEEANKVLIIMTPAYKSKADNRLGGAGFEYSMISSELYNMQAKNDKFLPILRNGTIGSSAPKFIQSNIYHDMTNDNLFDTTAYELLRLIYNKPKLIKPSLGKPPNFNENKDQSFVASANKIALEKKRQKKLENLRNTEQGVILAMQHVTKIFADIQTKAKEYNQKTEFELTTELFDVENNSIRLNADGYYVLIRWNRAWNNRISDCSISISSGHDPYYQLNQTNNFLRNVFLVGDKSSFTPNVDEDEKFVWINQELQFSTDAMVSYIFSLLLKTMENSK